MALINPNTNEYLKVTGFQADFAVSNLNIVYLIFANQEQRERYESGLSDYEVYKSGQFNGFGAINEALHSANTGKTTVYDELMNACYTALKNADFAEWNNG